MFGWQGSADRKDAKTLGDRAEPAAERATAQASSADLGARLLTVADLTLEGFAAIIGDITGQIDLLNATIESAHAVEVEHEFAIIAGEVRTLAGEIRQAADAIAAAVTASGSISGEVAAALTGIKDAIQHINELMANAAAADMVARHASQPLSLHRLCN
jgi:methyl-accepting chemotaxis protein